MRVYSSILESKGDIDCDIRWWIVVDLPIINLTNKDIQQLEGIRAKVEKDSIIKIVCIPLHNFTEAPVNVALKEIKRGFVCILDDDNIMHPRYIEEISSAIEGRDTIGMVYNQNLGRPKGTVNRRTRFIDYYKIKPGSIDSAQFTMSRDLIGNIKWTQRDPKNKEHFLFSPGDTPPITPDGDFIHKVYTANPGYFIVIKRRLCYHNYLSPESSNLDFSD